MNIDSLLITILTTIAPVAIMGYYIYKKDYLKPEPLRALLLTAFFGFIGGFLTTLLVWNLGLPNIYAIQESEVTVSALLHVMEAIALGYLVMMVILALLIIFNRHFDEQMDGIVYASFIALGFILCQNAGYLLFHGDLIVDTDAMRALFLVPIYFFCAIFSGYFVSRLYYRKPRWTWKLAYDLCCFIVIPFACHTVLTAILLASEIRLSAWLGALFCLGLIYVCFLTMNVAIQFIESHLARDVRDSMKLPAEPEQQEAL